MGTLLPLPIRPADALMQIIVPALSSLPQTMRLRDAQALLLAIALQESGLRYRRQRGNGPARSLWQFEISGCMGVLRHKQSRDLMRICCDAAGIEPGEAALYAAIEYDDILAAQAARLLLWTDPLALPRITDPAAAWSLYLRVWRPGKPRPNDWPENHAEAVKTVLGTGEAV